jgi:hypothetical protein
MDNDLKPLVGVVLVDVTYKAPKELNDVRLALVKLVEGVKAGKDVSQLAAENLGPVMQAVAGIDQLPEEYKQQLRASLETTGHLGGSLAGVLLSPAVPTA